MGTQLLALCTLFIGKQKYFKIIFCVAVDRVLTYKLHHHDVCVYTSIMLCDVDMAVLFSTVETCVNMSIKQFLLNVFWYIHSVVHKRPLLIIVFAHYIFTNTDFQCKLN